jgi:hypothetical protein
VDGDIVYRDGVFTRLPDAGSIVAEAERIGATMLQNSGLGHRLVPAWRM